MGSKIKQFQKAVAWVLVIGILVPVTAMAVLKVDPDLGSYDKVTGISGSLSSVGSDTLNNLMTLWAESFQKYYPNIKIQIEGKGSSTAPPSLISGTAQVGPMSRTMKSSEVDQFEGRFGYAPTVFKVAVDALAVFVHRDNPIEGMTFKQVDAVFSKTRRLGAKNEVVTWGQLGLTGEWADKSISLYGRNSASGTYGYFKKVAMKKGDYKDSVKEQPGSASVVQGISVDRYAIGYSGIGYATAGVRVIPLAKKAGEFYDPSPKNAYSGKYPLARFLYVYVNKKPNRALDPLISEFFKLVFSKEGQEVVLKDGYFPIDARLADTELAQLK